MGYEKDIAKLELTVNVLKLANDELEAALQSIKDDYEFCQTVTLAGRIDRSEAYYETACKALTKEDL